MLPCDEVEIVVVWGWNVDVTYPRVRRQNKVF